MTAQIYYFSGTGNSLHVARELKRRLPGTALVPIISALKHDTVRPTAETVGLVFPIHNLTAPIPVKRFLERVDLDDVRYTFAVATRFCSDKVFMNIDRVLARQGRSLDAAFSVELPCTYIPLFTIPTPDRVAKMEAELQRRLDEIQAALMNRQPHREKDSPLVFLMGHVLYPLITSFMFKVRFPDMTRSFYADSRCTGCGVCEKVCPTDRVRMRDGKPEWPDSAECIYCFACLHFCPAEAVQIRGRRTVAKGRYHHPEIRASDIAQQKQ